MLCFWALYFSGFLCRGQGDEESTLQELYVHVGVPKKLWNVMCFVIKCTMLNIRTLIQFYTFMIFLLLQAASASEGFCTKSMRDETETSFVKKTSVKKEIITCAVVGAIPAEVVGKKTVKRFEAAHDVRVRVAEKATLVYDAYAFQDKEGEERLEEVERALSHGAFFC